MNHVKRLQTALAAAKLDGILLLNDRNRYYTTGFHSSDGAVIVTPDKAYFITDSRYIEAAHKAVDGVAEVLLCSNENPMVQQVSTIVHDCGIERLGAEDASLTYADFLNIEKLLGMKLIPAQYLMLGLRQSKQPDELEALQRAQDITDKTFSEMLEVIRVGMTEREIAAELIYRMLRNGAEGTSFDPIVVTGANGSMPHGVPGDTPIAPVSFVTMDFGCRKDGYCSDMTRTVAVGGTNAAMRSVYETVLEAQLAGIAAAKAGVTGQAIDGAARTVIAQAGYGDYFGHGFGHSLGLDIHEAPNANPTNTNPMPVHAVISAEPGIYLPGWFGVRIEDVMHLTDDGAEVLTHSKKELIVL